MNAGSVWGHTEKRVPLVLSQLLAAGQAFQFAVTPQYDFRGENLVVDPLIAPSCTVQPPTVGPNVQVAGGSTTATFSGQMFPPQQTDCMRFGMDIANQGNQLFLNVASILTTGSFTFSAMIFGTVVEKGASMSGVHAGLAPAGTYRAGLAPAAQYRAGALPGHIARYVR